MNKFFAILFLASSGSLFADGATGGASGGGMTQTIMMIAVALAFFYFILWRPEQKKRKQMETLRSSLKKGDKITAMGILGTVAKIQDNTVIVSLCDGAKMEILKAAITDVQPGTEGCADKECDAK